MWALLCLLSANIVSFPPSSIFNLAPFIPLFFSPAHNRRPCSALLDSSLSWDPVDEISLHLGQFYVWWFILHRPISGAFQKHSRLFVAKTNQSDPPPSPTTIGTNETKWVRGESYVERTQWICCFSMQIRKKGERHHGYYPSGTE